MLEKQELCKDYMQGLEPCWKLCDAPFLAMWERESRHFNDESTSIQSYNWAKVKSNWDHMYTGVYKNNELVATGLVLIKRLPLSFCMYYLPRGPIMDYKDKELVQYYFDQLKKLAKKDHCIFIKFDPAIHVNDYDSKSYNINRYKETET